MTVTRIRQGFVYPVYRKDTAHERRFSFTSLSPHYFRFCLQLKRAGANVLGIGDEPYENLSPELRAALTEYYRVEDMHRYDALARALGYFTHHYGKIDRIDSLNEYWLGIMETVNEARHLYYYSLRDIPAPLEKIGRACLKAFEVKERFFHMEFFHTAADRYVALEVNMRPPGGYTTDMFNYGCDIDIYRIWAELLVHHRTTVDYTRKYHCCYASRKFTRRYVHSHEEILARYGASMVRVESEPGVFASALGDIGYIFRTRGLDKMMEIVGFIHRTEEN